MSRLIFLASFVFFSFGATTTHTAEEKINLPVPFTPEAPDGKMVKPWNNSCEEASIVMLDEFYKGSTEKTIPKTAAKTAILNYIAIEDKIFGYNANTNAAEMLELINGYSKYFEASIKTDPTAEEIKSELRAGRPVIALLYGYNLNNPRIQFARNGSYYHTFVIKGFDDETREFIVNDNGDLKLGLDLRYSYDTILGALRDYDHKTAKTVKPATVLFTKPRILVKADNDSPVSPPQEDAMQLVSSSSEVTESEVTELEVTETEGSKWNQLISVLKSWLDKFMAAIRAI